MSLYTKTPRVVLKPHGRQGVEGTTRLEYGAFGVESALRRITAARGAAAVEISRLSL